MGEKRQPVVFVGHGSPLNAIADNDIRRGWQEMGKRLGRPRAILAVSAHWFTHGRWVRTAAHNLQINDMYGFPDELYAVHYAPAGAPDVAARALDLLGGVATGTEDWGVDHGVWSVLSNMYPEADVPVVMVSCDGDAAPDAHLEVGRRLSALRDEGVMIVASGNVVHNLRAVDWDKSDGFDWADDFDDRVRDLILARDFDSVARYTQLAGWQRAIPTPDHFLPLLTALGAVRDDDETVVWNRIRELGSMSQTSYLFR